MKNLKLNLKGLYGYRQSLLSRSPQPRDNRETSERRPSEERTLLVPITKRFARYAVMLIMLLTLGVGQMWAYWYVPGTINGTRWGTTDNNMGGDNTITFYAVAAGTYSFQLTNGSNWSGNSCIKTISGATKGTDGSNATITTTAVKDITITVVDEGNWKVSVTASDPTYHIKYQFGGSWDIKTMISNGDGTYSCNGNYSGSSSSGFNYIKVSSEGDDFMNWTTSGITRENNPSSTSDKCIFTFKPSDNTLKIRKCNTVTKTNYIYFYNRHSWSDSYIYFVIGHPEYSATYRVTNIANTKLYYVANSSDNWTDAGYYGMIGAGSTFGSGSWGQSNLTAATHYTAAYTTAKNLASGKTILVKPNSTNSNGQAMTISSDMSSYTGLNYSQTVQKRTCTGANDPSAVANFTQTEVNSGTVTISAYKMTGNGTASNTSNSATLDEASETSASVDAAYSGKVTYTASANTGYTFVGWATSALGSITSSSASYDRYPTESGTVFARFKENQYTAYVQTYTHGSSPSPSSSTTMGQITGGAISVTPNTGYRFVNWTLNSGSGSFADATSASTTFYPTSNSQLRANIVAKTYTITLDDNGDYGGNGSATATYNSNTLSIASHATREDYRIDGYQTSGGTKVINADGSLVASVSGYTDGSSNWIKDDNVTLYAIWVYDVTNYTVTYGAGTDYTSYGSVSAYNNTSSAAVGASPASVRSGHSVTFTATPETGYEVEGWYTDAACSSGKHDAGNSTYTVVSVTGDLNIYVKFQPITYTVTWSPSSAPTGCAYTTKPTTGTYGSTVTMAITPSTGYTVSVSAVDASSNTVTISNPSTNTYTFTQPASAVTVTVTATQIMSTLSTSISYDGANPSYSNPTKSVSSIGIATTATVTATAAGTGYTFAGWTLTNCTRTDGGAATANPITVRSNGDGAAATVVANYEEDLSSPYTLKGGTNITGDDWATAHNFTKKTGHSTESVAYCTFNISSTHSGVSGTADDWSFKVIQGSTWYGLTADGDSWWYLRNSGQQNLSSSGKNIQLCADVAGPYEIKVDYSGTPIKVTVTFPTSYTLTYSIGSVAGTSGSISTSPSTASGSKVLSGNSVTLTAPAAKSGYTWKGWYTNAAGTEGNIPDVSRAITVTMNADKTLYACYTETMHTVTVAAGAGGTRSPATVSAGIATRSGEATATANNGYVFTNWTLPTGTSAAAGYTSSSNPIRVNATADSKTITANFAAATAFIEGRFHITNASRNGTWTNTFSDGDWDENSTRIKFTWDGTNSRYELHTYATPAELTSQISSQDPVFYIKESSSSSSLANVQSYWSATSQQLSAAGTANKRALAHTGTLYNNRLKFNSSTTNGYAVIYFDEAGIWYELEQRLQYNANGGTGSAPTGAAGNNTYHATNATITAPANTYTRTGYHFTGWKVNNAGDLISAGSSVTMSADKTLYAQWEADTYTNVTIDDNGGSADGAYSVTYYATSLTVTTTPTKTGYQPEGYYKEVGTTTKVANTDGSLNANKTYTDGSSHWISTASPTLYTKWQAKTYTVTLDKNGSYTSNGTATATYDSNTLTGITAPQRTGYSPEGYYTNAACTTKVATPAGALQASTTHTTAGSLWQTDDDATLYTKWSPDNYDVTLKANTGTGDDQVVEATYDAAMPTTLKAGGAVTVHTKTGYNLLGYWDNASTGNQYYSYNVGTSTLSSYRTWNKTSATDLYAHWSAKSYTVTLDLDEDNHGTIASKTTSQDVTYDAATTTVPLLPTAANGYALDGYYTDHDGEGTKLINADGTWIASVTGYTDGSTNWVYDDDLTLYAYYKKAEITNLALDANVVEPGDAVGVTPTVSPTPTGTTTICWEVRYADNDNPLDPQPGMTWSAGKLTFNAPAVSGLYKIVATLKTGNDCAGGTTLSTNNINVQVAGSHTVTIAYKYSGTDIAASASVTARPLVWSDPITAPDIFGYTFSSWSAGDGITITDDDGETSGTSSSSATIKIKATYNGTLTANYTPKSLIYFKNTLGWSSVYVNFYGENGYWDDKGSGNKTVTNRNKAMSRIGETDVWYYDYGAASITPTKWVSFTQDEQNGEGSGAQNFWASGTGEPVSYPARRADDLADKSGETGFYAATPMFVPLAGQTPVTKNESGGGKALYYNSGYWTKYLPGTGYTLEFYDNGTGDFIKSMDFTSADELMPMKAVADLEANTTYKFQIKRHGDVYLGNSGTMTYSEHGQTTPWEMTNSDFQMCHITTTAAGDYTFNFTYSAYHNESSGKDEYRLRISVDYPVGNGDYRLVYTDETRSYMVEEDKFYRLKPSAIVRKENNGSAIVSFFVRHNETPVLRIQQASVDGAGNITWNEYPTSGTPTNQITGAIASAITKDTVYNFNLSMNGSGALSVASAEYYSGNYYIRTDAANSKWDNYRTDPDHLMNYSEYLKSDVGYTHYYTHWVRYTDTGRKNVKFVIANDYSPCISDTLAREAASGTWANIATFMEEGGDLKRSANVRFMWDIKTNNIARAYIDGAQEDGTHFLELLSADSKIKNAAGDETLTSVTFSDNGNWIYEANVKAQPNAQIKLKSTWGDDTTIEQYFKGSSSETETLIGGSTTDWYDIRVIYDFKTNRLVASYVPSTGTISTDIPINADVMFIREHQGDIAQLTFSGSGAISKITTAYGVMRFNKWTINNKDKSTHLPLAQELSRFERDLFYISFPFRVNLEEVFGFGTYGTHWIIEEYNGAARAEKGFWKDTETFWEFITNRKGKFLEPNVGYLLALDLDQLGESSDVWTNTEQVELYFPSYGAMPTITSSSVMYNVPAHTCTINRPTPDGNRTIKDSHWNIISVPTYINTSNVTFANTDWITEGDGKLGPSFLYTVNWSDRSLTATSGVGYTYKAMHAYTVQYCGNVTWTTSVSPAVAPRRNPEAPKDAEYRLELRQNDVAVDQTFVRLSNDEHVTTGFEFNYDMSKEFNKNKANIYTIVSTMTDGDLSLTETAGNCLPMSEQTTVVPVGVKIAATGDYTFAIPEGTNGTGVTLIDNETGIRTPLSALDYTVNLTAGTYDQRFVIEISPVQQTPTGIESTEHRTQNTDVRKVMIDGILYIVKDGKVFDAQGALVK